MSFNQRFNRVIEIMNFKQVELAEKLGIHKSTVSKIVNGNIEPNLELLQNLRLKFGINLNWLVAGTGKIKDDLPNSLEVNEPASEYKQETTDALKETIKAQKITIELLASENERLKQLNK